MDMFLVYMGIALGIMVASLCGGVYVGSMLGGDKENVHDKMGPAILTSIILGLVVGLIYYFTSPKFIFPGAFFWEISIGLFVAIIICYSNDYDFSSGAGWCTGFLILFVGITVFMSLFGYSAPFKYQERAALIGEVETVNELTEVMEPADNIHICQVSKEIATTYANAALSKFELKDGAVAGSRYKIGSPTKQFVDGELWWIFPVEFSNYFTWNRDPQVPGYLRVSAEDPKASPQAVQYDKTGEEIHIKYLNSASVGYNAKRYLRKNGYLGTCLEDWTLEVDDNWRPYYTVTVCKRTLWFGALEVTGMVVLDLQTGEFKHYSVNNIPDWVDRVIPPDVIDFNAKEWGKYSKSSWSQNFFVGDKVQVPTEGWFLTYKDGQCRWFTGFTSNSVEDDALTGFLIYNARDGKATWYKVNGITENRSYEAALSLWSNFEGYIPTELVPYNIYGEMTYVIPMQYEGQFKGISLVSLRNISITAKGNTLEEALSSYRNAIRQAASKEIAPDSQMKEVQVTGVVERISHMQITGASVISFKLAGIGKVFQVAYSEVNPEVMLIKEGDEITITYLDTTEVVVMVDSLDIIGLELEEGSVTQARNVENQQTVDQEVDRVDDQEQLDELINSDEFRNIDPAALEEFLQSQETVSD